MTRVRFGIIGALLAVAWAAPIQAQQATGTIRGRVVDEAQQPLARASVAVGSRGAVTGADGRYIITGVPTGAATVRARMLGYGPVSHDVTVVAGYPVNVDFTLTAQAISLAEVVVTGYGEQTAGDITGAVTHLSPDEFNPGRITAPAQLLQSKVAGVQVVNSNEPGATTQIRIRGATSVTASSNPLYVVDGMPLGDAGGLSAGRDPLNFINPNDIESIVVLKDASAAAIYGANAANGVVLITTKSGATGRQGQVIEYSSSASASSVERLPQVLNAAQFRAVVDSAAPSKSASLANANTNWLDLVSRTAYGQEQNLSLTNAGERTFYRLSFGYLRQDGIIRGTTTERLSLGLNYEQRLLDGRLDFKLNLKGSRANDRFTPGEVLGNATSMAPTQPVYDSTSATGYWNWGGTNAGSFNPIGYLNQVTNQGTTWRSVGNMQGEYRLPFLDGLKANINLGYDVAKAGNSTFYPNNVGSQVIQGHGSLTITNNTQLSSLLEAYLNYTGPIRFVPGNIDLTGGYSYTQSHSEYPFFQETNLSSNWLNTNGIASAANYTNTLNVVDYRLISFFGRANYNYNDRYLASFSIRRDGSSRFAPSHQWGVFPAVSGAWRLSQESFTKGFRSLSDLKLRASWAKTGNQAFGDYLQYTTYQFSTTTAMYPFGGTFYPTIRPSAVDPNIHWEETQSYDVGLDYGFLNQRFSGSIDWYTKKTKDLIFTVPAAAGTNFANYVTTNLGSMENKGIEFSLSARILEARGRGLGWTADFTVSHNANKLVSLANAAHGVTQIPWGNISGGVGNTVQVLMPGEPIFSFLLYEQKYANGKPVYSANALDMYVDRNNDGIINGQDMRPIHSPWPSLELGHTSLFTYHNFDASFTLRAQLGNYVYNNVASANGSYQNVTSTATPSNMNTSILKTGFAMPQYWSDYYLESASFLRMDNISVGYTWHVSGRPWRLYLTVQNAFTITGYSGVDPTAGLNGIDNNIYPRSRTFTGGLSVRF